MKCLVIALFAVFTLAACVVTPGPAGYGGVTVSPLPSVVVLGSDPYYYHSGYYYYYHDSRWRYSKSKGGPWTDLPKSYWPKETRYGDRDRDHDRGRGDDGHGDRGDYHDRDSMPDYHRH